MKMKKRSGRSRRSPDPTSPPSGPGEPASPPCQSVEVAPTSHDKCGGGGTSSAPAFALVREGGDEGRSNRAKQRRKKAKRHTESSVPGSTRISPPRSRPPDLQEGEVSSAPIPGKRFVSKADEKRSLYRRMLFNFPEDEYEDGQSGKTPSLNKSQKKKKKKRTPSLNNEDGQSDKTPVDLSKIAQDEEVSCDGGETSSQTMVEEKPKSSSGHHDRIAQEDEEDGYSGKTAPSTDLIGIIVQDEHGQYSSKWIGVHDIDGHKKEQGRARGRAQDLLDADDETISKKISYFSKLLINNDNDNSPERDYCPEYEPEELIELYERLALYRIRAYELTVDRTLAALDDVNLKLLYPSSKLYDEGFFKYYEEYLEWYFDPELCKNAHFDDYQRITLRSFGEYLDWERYHSTLNTYEQDMAYVQYCEVLANETKWVEDYMGDRTHRGNRIQDVVYIQALEIAVGFPNVSLLLVSYGFREHIRTMEFNRSHKGLDGLYFEIWKRVANGKMSFREALLEVHNKDMFPSLSLRIKLELELTEWGDRMQDFYDAHVAGIDKMASDDKALELITEAVTELFPRDWYYLDYAKKKLDIAKDIGLISKGSRREVAPQDNGENGKEKVSLEKSKQAMTDCEKGTVALLT